MIYLGKNKFPCKYVCCVDHKRQKKTVDLKVSWICGAEFGKAIMTFFLINIPLPLFSILTGKFFYEETELKGWRVAMTIQILLIPVINYFFLMTSLSDPGIVPGRTWNWSQSRKDIARRYKNVNANNKIFYNMVNP